jgi:CBS domain containing-hemolysin-like protein
MTILLISVAVALAVSFICSLAEATLLSLTPSQVAELSEKRPLLGTIWRDFKTRIDRPIAVILLLNTTAHTIGATVAGAQFDELYGDQWIWVFSIALTLAMLQFTEILPKTLGVQFNRQLAPFLAVPLSVAVRVASPLITVMHLFNKPFEGRKAEHAARATRQEISALAAMARLSKDIDTHQERIIRGAARLSERTVREVMIPMGQVVTLSTAQSLSRAIIAAHLDAHTRFPVCEDGDRDRVAGYVNFKEMIYFMSTNPADPSLNGIIRPVHFVAPDRPATELMQVFLDEHKHIAIVRDEAGRSLGLVTLEDMMKEMLGELGDEFDRLPKSVHALSGGTFMFGGGVTMNEVSAALGGVLPPGPSTLAAWLEEQIGQPPAGGQAIKHSGADILVRRVRRGRVFEASVTTTGVAGGGAGAAG